MLLVISDTGSIKKVPILVSSISFQYQEISFKHSKQLSRRVMPILSPDLLSVDEFFNIRYADNNVLIADRMKTIIRDSNRIKAK